MAFRTAKTTFPARLERHGGRSLQRPGWQFVIGQFQPMPVSLPQLAPRRPDSHKGDFGHALLIGGSVGMAGSISLSAMACLRSGAGLVTVATPAACQPTVAGFEPSLMTVPLPCDAEGRIASAALRAFANLPIVRRS